MVGTHNQALLLIEKFIRHPFQRHTDMGAAVAVAIELPVLVNDQNIVVIVTEAFGSGILNI